MTLSLAAERAAFLCEVRLGAWHDALVTLDRIEHDYPDEAHRILETIATTIAREVAA